MAYSGDDLNNIYDKTNGYWACCNKKLAFTNYGTAAVGNKGHWEVAHGRTKARGGSSHFGNLWAMCMPCNRGMGAVDAVRWCRR